MIPYLVLLSVIIADCVSFPKFFEKAGQNPSAGYIPFYNYFVLLKMLNRPWWWVFILLVPGVNILMLCVFHYELFAAFGKRSTKELASAIFIPMVVFPQAAFKEELKFGGPVNWKEAKKNRPREWFHAISFAVIAATIIRTFFLEAFKIPTPSMERSLLVGDFLFVSKMSYGPRVPMTPFTFPFTHHTLPIANTKSYTEWFSLPYYRLPGFGDVERMDAVVFNFPEGDTVLVDAQEQSVSQHARDLAYRNGRGKFTDKEYEQSKQYLLKNFDWVDRPIDKKDNYIKRCIGLPGETLEVKGGEVFVDGKSVELPEHMQYEYIIETSDRLNPTVLKEAYGISYRDIQEDPSGKRYSIPMSPETAKKIEAMNVVKSITQVNHEKGYYNKASLNIFPNKRNYDWSEDNFGPLYIPKKGEKIALTVENLPLYAKIISAYEGKTIGTENGKVTINGSVVEEYTFEMDYYFMMGDNRHHSADSRFWGFVPENHIVGKAVFVWLSIDPESGIRWNRLFSLVD